jgi:hypothetical protein
MRPNAGIEDSPGWIPARINLENYPQLKQLAWQLQGSTQLKPAEALGIYERNWRHVDTLALEPRERNLIVALRQAFGDALAALGRKVGLANEDFEVLQQVSDKTPAEPLRFE